METDEKLEEIRQLLDRASELADGISNHELDFHRASRLSFLPDRIKAAQDWVAELLEPPCDNAFERECFEAAADRIKAGRDAEPTA